jgi:peptidase M28-like protein
VTDYAALLREIAVPRLVGTPNHQLVRAALRRELSARGYAVEEHPFSGRPSWMLLGTPRLVHGVNLIATRGSDRPSVWLTAHYDSKGQPISMAARLAGVIALVLGAGSLAVALIPALVLLAAGVLVLAQNRATDRSPGAVDNASGLLAVLAIVDRLPRSAPVGVILLDAEEFGLVGARALARDRPELLRDAAVVNFDGLDDPGRPIAFVHRRGPLGRAVAGAVNAIAAPWWPVVVDGIALAGPARECVTIMKGGWGTTRVVHTPRDAPERLTLAGVMQVADAVARVFSHSEEWAP